MFKLFLTTLLLISTNCFGQLKQLSGTWKAEIMIPSPFKGIKLFNLSKQDFKSSLILNFIPVDDTYSVLLHDPDNRTLRNILQFQRDINSEHQFSLKSNRFNFYCDNLSDTLMEGKCTYQNQTMHVRFIKQNTDINFKRPQHPSPPYPYATEDVLIQHPVDSSIKIAGTLSIPKDCRKYPTVIIVPGSGGINRDGLIATHKVYHVIADYLNRNGIAVMRYDKRGIGKSTGKYNGGTVNDLATDVLAIVEYLKQRHDIDSTMIGLMGHSMGGMISFKSIKRDPNIAFLVTMGAVGKNLADIKKEQCKAMLQDKNYDEDNVKEMLAFNNQLLNIIQTHSPEYVKVHIDSIAKTILPDSLKDSSSDLQFVLNAILAMYTPFDYSAYQESPQEYLETIMCPTLILNGTKDLVVDQSNAVIIESTLRANGNKNATCVIYPSLNHIFQKCETGAIDEYIWIEETINMKVVQDIHKWIMSVCVSQ